MALPLKEAVRQCRPDVIGGRHDRRGRVPTRRRSGDQGTVSAQQPAVAIPVAERRLRSTRRPRSRSPGLGSDGLGDAHRLRSGHLQHGSGVRGSRPTGRGALETFSERTRVVGHADPGRRPAGDTTGAAPVRRDCAAAQQPPAILAPTVPVAARTRLVEAARAEAAWLELVTGTAPVGAVAEIANAANRVLSRNADYVAELATWTRRGDDTRDGVPAAVGGPSPEPQDLFPQRILSDRDRAPGRDFESEPLVAILGTAGDSLSDQLKAGYALQRVLLTIADLGLAASMLSQPIEVPAAREQLRLALGRFGAPQIVLRVGFGQPAAMTPRRDPAEVIDAARVATT